MLRAASVSSPGHTCSLLCVPQNLPSPSLRFPPFFFVAQEKQSTKSMASFAAGRNVPKPPANVAAALAKMGSLADAAAAQATASEITGLIKAGGIPALYSSCPIIADCGKEQNSQLCAVLVVEGLCEMGQVSPKNKVRARGGGAGNWHGASFFATLLQLRNPIPASYASS